MKKIILSLLVVAASLNVFAAIDYTAKAKIKVTSSTEIFDQVTIASSASFSSTANKYCVVKQMENLEVAIYAELSGAKYGTLALNDLEGAALAVKTDEGTNYTVSFSNVSGETLYLVDAVANKYTEITEGGSYAFTAEANQTIADRFSITKVLPLPDYLFIGDQLTIGEVEDGAVINLQYFTYDNGKRVLGDSETSTEKVIELSTAKGYCEVSYTNKAGVERKFIVNPAPVVTPAND